MQAGLEGLIAEELSVVRVGQIAVSKLRVVSSRWRCATCVKESANGRRGTILLLS